MGREGLQDGESVDSSKAAEQIMQVTVLNKKSEDKREQSLVLL
jgi:hypothetical protein